MVRREPSLNDSQASLITERAGSYYSQTSVKEYRIQNLLYLIKWNYCITLCSPVWILVTCTILYIDDVYWWPLCIWFHYASCPGHPWLSASKFCGQYFVIHDNLINLPSKYIFRKSLKFYSILFIISIHMVSFQR